MTSKIEMEASAPYRPAGFSDYSELIWDIFHWFGDPTMDMRTAVPHELSVTAPYYLPEGSTQATFSVSEPEGAVENALVCITHDNLWASGLTDESGNVTLTFDPIGNLNDICWMATAHNALPKEDVINTMGIGDDPEGVVTIVGSPHPNPASGQVTFPVSLSGEGLFEMTIYDTVGRTVAMVHSGELEAGAHSFVWDISDVPQGIYMIRSIDPAGSITTNRVVVCK